jgi:archaellum component FlaG (FlaF/FlaG flagellin family)
MTMKNLLKKTFSILIALAVLLCCVSAFAEETGETESVNLPVFEIGRGMSGTISPDFATEINPQKVEEKGDSLFYTFEVKKGEKQTYRIQPVSIIILDNKYENKEVVLSEDK